MSRDAGHVLEAQNERTEFNLERLRLMKAQAEKLRAMTLGGIDVADFGRILREGWEQKRLLAEPISNETIDAWYRAGMAAGAYGGKLCGAGGGGFLLFLAARDRHAAIRAALADLQELQVGYEPNGVRVLIPSIS
jgi:D-glycero-alpha-D-manno-heptose-7-phosphate kinase